MELFTLFGKIAVNDKEANKNIDSVTGKAKQSEGVMSKAFSNIGKVVAGAFTVGAIATFEKKIVSTYATYDDQMRKVQAVSGATGKQFMDLRAKAEELGAKTRFSATEAGEGMENLARAGWKTGEIMEGIGPVLSFATANAIDLGSAAGIVSDGLSQFGLKAKDTTMFTDVLSATAAAANTDIGLLGETFKYVGPVAGSLGYKLQDVSVAIGLMANKGIKGSQAGTSLRSALTRLANPTGDSAKKMKELGISLTDSTGKVKPFTTLMQELRGRFSKLSDAQKAQYASTIFGQEAMSGMLAVVNATPEEFNKMTKAVTESNGQTQKMADTMDGGLGGAIAGVKSAWEGLLIKLGSMQDGILVDAFKKLAEVLQALPNEIEYVSNKIKELTTFYKEHETIIKAVVIVLGTLATGFMLANAKAKIAKVGIMGFMKGFKLVKGVTPILNGIANGFKFLKSPMGATTIAIAVFAAAAYLIYKNWDKIGPWLKNEWEFIKNTISSAIDAIKSVITTVFGAIKTFIVTIWTAISNFFSTIWEGIKTIFTAAFLGIKFIIESAFTIIVTIIRIPLEFIKALFTTIWSAIGDTVMAALNGIRDFIMGIWNGIVDFFTGIFEAIQGKIIEQIMWEDSAWNRLKEIVTNIWNAIKDAIMLVVNKIREIVTTVWNVLLNITMTVFNAMKSFFLTVWNGIKSIITSVVNVIKTVITTAWNVIKTVTTTVWNSIKAVILGVWNSIKAVITGVINVIKSIITGAWNGIKSVTSSVWNGIKMAMVTPVNAARDKIKSIVDAIKGFFSKLKLKLPKIEMPKLPHFSLDGKFSLKPPSVPKLKVDWYAEGGILTKPTLFGINGDRAMVGGEAGPEAVLPISKLSGILMNTLNKMGYGVPQETNVDIELSFYNALIKAIKDSGLGNISMDGQLVGKFLNPHTDRISGTNLKLIERGLSV